MVKNKMNPLYAILTTIVALLLAPVLALAAVPNLWSIRQRLSLPADVRKDSEQPLMWFHAASVGEVAGMTAVVTAFQETYPTYRIAISTMTPTGLNRARQSIPDADCSFLLPFDIPFLMGRLVKRLRPAAIVLLEGELWPSLLHAARKAKCPVALVNGRMSDRSYPRNRWGRPLLRRMLSGISLIGAQTELDAERLKAFGANPDRVTVTGNLKFDQATSVMPPPRIELRRQLGLSDDARVFIAGCPRPVREERAVLDACIAVHAAHPDVTIIWAPRHLARLDDVERMLDGADLAWLRRSALNETDDKHAPVILLDTMGELATLYGAADVAFVGATLVPLGGHNLLEPASHGVPVVFGPNTQNVRASAEALLTYGGGIEVHDGIELAETIIRLLNRPGERARMGEAASAAAQSGHGALERTIALLTCWGL